MTGAQIPAATFYFDLGSPYAYLAAERLHALMPGPVRWQPISLGALFKLNGRSSWAAGEREPRARGIAEVQRRARAYGLPPLRWPEPWPGHYLTAMRAAIFAAQQGHAERFALCAFRAAFQRGLDLSVAAHVFAVADEAGLDPHAVELATGSEAIKLALREATDAAHRAGVLGVPTVRVGEDLFWGEDRLEQAAAAHGSRLESETARAR